MPGDTAETREPSLEQAKKTLSFADGMAAPNDDLREKEQLIAQAQVEATLAVAEELRALREHFEGGAVEVHYGGTTG